jgi:hypothetical protein
VQCNPAFGITTTGFWPAEKQPLLDALAKIPYQKPPWSTRYPQLVNILDDEPGIAKRNEVTRNICWESKWLSLEARAAKTAIVKDNLTDQDPRFVNAAKGDFRLREDSPAWKLGFERIPVEKIGLYKDDLRATWPVANPVRPAPPKPPVPKVEARKLPPLQAPKVAGITVDGIVTAGEWTVAPVAMREDPGRNPVKGAPVSARVCHDGKMLYVAMTVPVADVAKLKRDGVWGQSDGMEVVFRDASGKTPGPVFAVRGFADGSHESTPDGGAPEAPVQKLGQATRFVATVGAKEWTGEWAIPLEAAGIKYKPGLKLGFNLGVLRTEDNEWTVWQGALGTSLQLDNGGILVLE